MVNRREFLRIAGLGGMGLFLPWKFTLTKGFEDNRALAQAPPFSVPTLDPNSLTKYLDALPVPGVMRNVGMRQGAPFYRVAAAQVRQKLHRQVPPTQVWGYGAAGTLPTYPGRTFEVRSNQPIRVQWENALPQTHMLPIDFTLNGANNGAPQVRTVMHVHGAHVGPESDGGPEAWFTRGFRQTGPDFAGRINYYPNSQAAATLWYHDHAMGITRLNVYAGLAGFYLVRDAFEDGLNLPKGKYEIPLAVQDRSLNLDGSLFYPDSRYFFGDPAFPTPIPPDMPPVWNPEFFGNLMVTNGKIWPFHRVEPRKYRLRLLNGCDSRFLVLKFDDATGLTFTQIGTDGGFLPAPVTVNQIIMGPGERADVIVDFSAFNGASLILRNIAPDEPFGGVLPDPLNPDAPLPADPATTGQVMEFRVTQRLSGPDTSVIPGVLVPAPVFGAPTVRDVTLNELVSVDFDAPIAARLGDANGGLPFDAPITEKPASGATEIWRIINLTADTHPIHLHLVQFLILDRQPFDPALYVPGDPIPFTGAAVPPDANELGPKDTIRANPGEVTRIIAKFDLPADVATPAKYVWHCHILSHEDNEMMRPYEVVADV